MAETTFIQQLSEYVENNSNYKRGVDLFIGKQPDRKKQVNCIMMRQTGGIGSTGEISDIMDLTVQFVIRNKRYKNGEVIAKEIRDLFHGQHYYNLESGGYEVMYSQCLQDYPAHIGQDENGNDEFSINVHLKVR